jgi:hypothetical protein
VNGRSQARPRCPAHALGVTEIGFQRPRVSDAPRVSVYNLLIIGETGDLSNDDAVSGDAAAIGADLRALRDLGVIAVDFSFDGGAAGAVLAEMRRFRETVLAKV